jgi:hypothetical protein
LQERIRLDVDGGLDHALANERCQAASEPRRHRSQGGIGSVQSAHVPSPHRALGCLLASAAPGLAILAAAALG